MDNTKEEKKKDYRLYITLYIIACNVIILPIVYWCFYKFSYFYSNFELESNFLTSLFPTISSVCIVLLWTKDAFIDAVEKRQKEFEIQLQEQKEKFEKQFQEQQQDTQKLMNYLLLEQQYQRTQIEINYYKEVYNYEIEREKLTQNTLQKQPFSPETAQELYNIIERIRQLEDSLNDKLRPFEQKEYALNIIRSNFQLENKVIDFLKQITNLNLECLETQDKLYGDHPNAEESCDSNILQKYDIKNLYDKIQELLSQDKKDNINILNNNTICKIHGFNFIIDKYEKWMLNK